MVDSIGNKMRIFKLINLQRNIHLLFENAIKIDKELFGSLFRQIIPLPFIFKYIDYLKLLNEGEQVLINLYNTESEIILLKRESFNENSIIDFMLEYTQLFIKTQVVLNNICQMLYIKSENKGKVKYSDYNKMCKEYNSLYRKRHEFGLHMNDLSRSLGMNAPI